MADLEFITYLGCPFAQRTHLLLLEKGIDHTVTDIDLSDKPKWFEEISPYSKVPVVRRGDETIWESAIINEYLEEVYPDPPLMPSDPSRRALARFWIDFANVGLCTTWYRLLLAREDDAQKERRAELREHFLFMERDGIGRLGDGPYWMGADLSLVDLTFYPWFERLPVVEHYRDFTVPDACTRLKAWKETMETRDSVKRLAHPVEYFIKNAAKYAKPASAAA